MDLFKYTGQDLTSDGRIPLIISTHSSASMRKLRKVCRECFEARIRGSLPIVNGFRMEVDPKHLPALMKALPDDAGVVLDSRIKFPDPRELIQRDEDRMAKPKLSVATSTLRMEKVWDKGYTGKGIGIAVIDSGIYPHPDLEGRIVGWADMTNEKKPKPVDPFGHGTHVAGDAAGSGKMSAGKIKGIAPDANLVGIRIGTVSEAIKAIRWAIENKDKYNIKVINMSLGDVAIKSYKEDPWAQAAEKAVKKGIVVVVAAGNEGPEPGTISTPGINPNVITVGAIDDRKTPDRADDAMASFSSRGPTSLDKLPKPDVVAPGVSIYAPLSPNSTLDTPEMPHIGTDYIAMSGTSMATPLVSGLAAILLQANPKLTPKQVREILTSTAYRLPAESGENVQGAGMIEPEKALKVALALANEEKALA